MKQQLAASAVQRGTSVASEARRLLAEQLNRPVDHQAQLGILNVRLVNAEAQHSALQGLVTFYEDRILELVEGNNQHALKLLELAIHEARREREMRRQEGVEKVRQARNDAEQAEARKPRAADAFDGLLSDAPNEVLARMLDDLEPEERRRLNLVAHLDASPRGTKSALARSLGWTQARLSHLLARRSKSEARPLYEHTARKIEAALKLAPGFLDKKLVLELDRSSVKWHKTLLVLETVRETMRKLGIADSAVEIR